MKSDPTFLVIDDDTDGRYLTRRALERKFPGADIVEAATCAEALAQARRVPLDAVVTDHHLDHDDGAACIEGLRAQGIRCPIVMVTGSSDPRVHARAQAAGATRVFAPGDLEFSEYLASVLRG